MSFTNCKYLYQFCIFHFSRATYFAEANRFIPQIMIANQDLYILGKILGKICIQKSQQGRKYYEYENIEKTKSIK